MKELIFFITCIFSFFQADLSATSLVVEDDKCLSSIHVQEDISDRNDAIIANTAMMCRVADSLVLVDLYNSASGFVWFNQWVLSLPMDTWHGVSLNSSGCVEQLSLGSNNLTGTIPPTIGQLASLEGLFFNSNNLSGTLPTELGNLTALSELQANNNLLTGTIPNSLGNLTELVTLFLDDNNLTGEIPQELGMLNKLTSLFLDNNELQGAIPISFASLPALFKFDFFNNHIDSVPDLSSSITLSSPGNLSAYGNRLTFDDILPNIIVMTGKYADQDSVFVDTTINLMTGIDYTLDLGFDSAVPDNVYQWYKKSSTGDVLYNAPININKFSFTDVSFADAGEYYVKVTNPRAPDLELVSRCIEFVITCGSSTYEVDSTICLEDQIVINSVTYDIDNSSGVSTLSLPDRHGCDSIISVNLDFYDKVESDFIGTFCREDTFIINNTAYHLNNPIGTEVFNDATSNTCDSTVNINLSFYTAVASTTLNPLLCREDSLIVNDEKYDFGRPSGVEILKDASVNGCDSVVTIDLLFYPVIEENSFVTICREDSVIINGTTYNFDNPSGTETLENANRNGCDSTVNIFLNFHPIAQETINPIICDDDSFELNDHFYDIDNSFGIEVLENATSNGCDSTVTINLDFYDLEEGMLDTIICRDDQLEINGNFYDIDSDSGTEILEDAGANGCDSTLNINLDFYPLAEGSFEPVICLNDTLEYNNTIYDINHSFGIEVLEGAAQHGCDSIVTVNVDFHPQAEGNYNPTICVNDTIVFNNTIYDINHQVGTEILIDSSANGCDSIVNISLSFFPIPRGSFDTIICEEDNFNFNGTIYNASNLSGTDTLTNASVNGCDSLVDVSISFHPPAMGELELSICEGTSTMYNGTIYSNTNLSGTEILPDASQHGCDSIVEVTVVITQELESFVSPTICETDSIIINDTIFNFDRPTGVVRIDNAGVNGCDSVINVDLNFYPPAINNFTPTICAGDTLFINDEFFTTTSNIGTQVLPGASINGCDSIINIEVNFDDPIITNFNPTICPEDSILINGNYYHIDQTSGTEIFKDITSDGCDSTVNINLSFFDAVVTNFNPTICEGDSILVNEIYYHANNLTGTEIFNNVTANGCDSTVVVNLSFFDPVTTNINPTICEGDSILINDTYYHAGLTTGTEVFENASSMGCDSTVVINLSFYDPIVSNFNPTICEGDSILINDTYYHASLTTGTEVFENASSMGCDSTVVINLSFYDPIVSNFNPTICEGDSILINDTYYHAGLTTGTEIFENASSMGCDSTININLNILSPSIENLNPVICQGDSIEINGTWFHADNVSDTQVLEGANSNNCDSIINISLSFYEPAVFNLNRTLCEGTQVIVNEEIYDVDNPTGTEILQDSSANGCDSIVNINLSFNQVIEIDRTETLCLGDSIIVNGTVYNESRTNGVEMMVTSTGCDSVVTVSLDFHPPAIGMINTTHCEGDTVIINNQIYTIANPSGMDVIENGSANACDSTLMIDLIFNLSSSNTFAPTLCENDTVIVNGQIYDINNPTGTEILSGANAQACDSVILVDLNFRDPVVFELVQTLCTSDTMMINGTDYYMGNPTGTEILTNQSANGCDSIININLSFEDAVVNNINMELCDGASIIINGEEYDASMPTGTDTIPNGSVNGCDSIININLSFIANIVTNINTVLCVNDTLVINDTPYHLQNPAGTEVLQTATGCDSILQINLNFDTSVFTSLTDTICSQDTFFLNNVPYVESGIYTETIIGGSITGCDSSIVLNLTVIDQESLGPADSGPDFISCEYSNTVIGMIPDGVTAIWTSPTGAEIMNPELATTEVFGLSPGNNQFVLTSSTPSCPNYANDSLNIFVEGSPIVRNDSFYIDFGNTNPTPLDVLTNDDVFPASAWSLNQVEEVGVGFVEKIGASSFQYLAPEDFSGESQFSYEVCNTICPNACDTALVYLFIGQAPPIPNVPMDSINIPNGITPNGDGINDRFVIPELLLDNIEYPNNELIVMNRWGDIVYEAQPYRNDWEGTNQAGKTLPQGTYYYVLRLDIAKGIIYRGDITILK